MLRLVIDLAIYFFIRECVSYSHNTDGGLNNGDMITVEWECNDKLAESKFGHKLKYSTIEKKIENNSNTSRNNIDNRITSLYITIKKQIDDCLLFYDITD